MNSLQKTIVSFLLFVVFLPMLLAGIINILSFKNPLFLFPLAFLLAVLQFKFGKQVNGEFEETIPTFMKQRVSWWTIPPGISWWFLRPLGGSVRKTTLEKQTVVRTVESGKPYATVKTRDGGTVDIGIVYGWHITNAQASAIFPPGELAKRVDSLQDRAIRFFALKFDAEEEEDVKDDSALANKKVEFSLYLMGAKNIFDLKGSVIANDLKEKAGALGVTFDNVDVVDVNEPQEVQDARNAAMAEHGQARKEKLDVNSIRLRVLELMWGTSDPAEIKKLKDAGEQPLMSNQEALTTVRTARGDMTQVNVSGDGGDFTKGSVAGAKVKETKGA